MEGILKAGWPSVQLLLWKGSSLWRKDSLGSLLPRAIQELSTFLTRYFRSEVPAPSLRSSWHVSGAWLLSTKTGSWTSEPGTCRPRPRRSRPSSSPRCKVSLGNFMLLASLSATWSLSQVSCVALGVSCTWPYLSIFNSVPMYRGESTIVRWWTHLLHQCWAD